VNKDDFRLQMPLWNAGLIFIGMIILFSLVYTIDTRNDLQNMSLEGGTFLSKYPAFIPFLVGSILFIIFIYMFSLKLNQYNKMNPTRKMNLISLLQLPEFVDDDEMMHQITNTATRKVYVYYSNMIPFFTLLLFFPLHRYVYIVAISVIIIGHYIVYYRHLSKYAEGISKTHVPLFNKRIVTATFAALFIFAAAIFGLFYKVEKDLQADRAFMEDCFHKGGTIVLTQTTSSSEFSCKHE
jgi:hypothetical protein